MEQSTNYNFNLPSKSDETPADIDLISDNFRTVDDIVKQVQDDVSKIPTNLVNGSAEGSLRGVNAKAEKDGYIMGESAVSLGSNTIASGRYSHAEGLLTTASGAMSHAEGNATIASGAMSHAEGKNDTTASGDGSHAEGSGTTASGNISHAEGAGTIAGGLVSHAEGVYTSASGYCQHAQGKYNIADTNNRYAHIVGNGENERNRSNAHTLDWNGNAWFAGDVYVGGTSQDDESATKLSSVAEKLKNHTSFSVLTSDANAKTYIKLGKFTGDGAGGRAIFTINGKVGWNNKNDGGLKVLTLSSNDSRDTTSTDIFTGGSFFDFGHSDNDGTSIIEDTPDIQVAIVRPSDYTVKEVDIYLKFSQNKYSSYLITVDYSGTCKWETDVKPVNATDPDPMETALSSYIVPKKRFGGVEEGANKTVVDTALSTTSTNPVQNNVLTNKFENIKELKTPKEAVTTNLYTAPYCQSDIVTDSFTELNKYRTTLGTATISGEWNNIISVRHRNGGIAGDGQYYGMYLRAPMTHESNLKWRYQTGGIWGTERTLLDSSNFTNYIPYETGTCTLSASNGTVSNATYSVVGNMVTLNFNIAPTGAGNVVVSGFPFTATKNQSGFVSSTATYNISANQTSVSINSTSGTAEYCTVTYLK